MIDIADRLEISQLFARLGQVLDGQRNDDITTVYDEDIVVYTPRGDLHGIEEVRAYLKRSKDDDEFTQSFQGGVVVEVNDDGESATATTNQLVHYYRASSPPHRRSGLRASYTVIRTRQGWRLSEGRIKLAWTQDL